MAGMLRTWLSALNADFPHPQEPIDINHPIVPWLCRWCAFVWARYHVKADRLTPFRIMTGREYKTPIFQFGEVVLAKDPNVKAISKAKPRWFKGVFVGRLELDDSAVVLTDAGAIIVRTIRRLPADDQHDVSFLDAACGLPWAPAGKRAKVRAETSHVIAVPAPVAAPPDQPAAPCPGQQDERSEPALPRPPVTPGVDPQAVHHDIPSPGTPLSEARGMTPDSSHRITMTPPFADEVPRPASPFRGSGSMQVEREVATPTGINAVPLPRPAASVEKPSAPAASEPAAATAESSPEVPKVGSITCALQQIQDWARDGQWEQKISSVLDLLDTRLDPREVEKARDIQMATLIEKDFAKPRLKADMPRKAKLLFFRRTFFRLVRLCVGRASCQRPATGLLRRLRQELSERQLGAVAGVAGPNRQLQQALRVRAQGSERCECGPAARERGDCCGPRPRDPIPGASAS